MYKSDKTLHRLDYNLLQYLLIFYLCNGNSTTISGQFHELIHTECILVKQLNINILGLFLTENIQNVNMLLYIHLLYFLFFLYFLFLYKSLKKHKIKRILVDFDGRSNFISLVVNMKSIFSLVALSLEKIYISFDHLWNKIRSSIEMK